MVFDLFVSPAMFFPMFFSLTFSLVGLVLVLYGLYDLLFQQPGMDDGEKLIWIAIILLFNVLGVLAYFFVVWYLDERPFKDFLQRTAEDRKLGELERLADLHDRGALTDEEFQEEKNRILHGRDPEKHDTRPDQD